jgi:uncharacterized protein (TIGR00297 family)
MQNFSYHPACADNAQGLIVNQRSPLRRLDDRMAPDSTVSPAKAIPSTRDHLQSKILVWALMPLLSVLSAVRVIGLFIAAPERIPFILESLAISIVFALLAWRLKAATPIAATCGGVICLFLIFSTNGVMRPPWSSALLPLVVLFILTFLATRTGRRRKALAGLAESRKGRTTSQIAANLGFAALFAFPLGELIFFAMRPGINIFLLSQGIAIGVLSALAEATADTVSSEIGQAFGGTPILLTTLRQVPPGTDGAITLLGTFAGIAAAAIIAITGIPALGMSLTECALAFAAGVAGLFFDSLLGATLERRGWLGNDLVNFLSTAFAATTTLIVIRFAQNTLLR